MNVISVVRKYIIKDLTGVIEDYYIQHFDYWVGKFGCWKTELSFCSPAGPFWDDMVYQACYGGHIEIVKLWCQHGEPDQEECLERAARGGHMKMIQYLKPEGKEWNFVMIGASRVGNLNIVKLAVEHGANEWYTGLWDACFGGHLEMVKLMIEKGVKRDWDVNKWPWNKHEEIREYLISLN